MNLLEKITDLQDQLKELLGEARKEGYQEGLDDADTTDADWREGYEAMEEEVIGLLKGDLGDVKEAHELIIRVRDERDALRKDKERMDWLSKFDDAMFGLTDRMNTTNFREAVDQSMEES